MLKLAQEMLSRLSQTAGQQCSDANGILWCVAICCSAISIAMSFEIVQLHAGPARATTFFLPFIGYWAQCCVSGIYLLFSGTWRRGKWNCRNTAALMFASGLDGTAQALNFVAQIQGGMVLFTIFQSFVTIFASLIALMLPWTPRIKPSQWSGICFIVCGVLLTSIPEPIMARQSFAIGMICSVLSSLCLAISYPVSELVFHLTPEPPSEEMACFCATLGNVVVVTAWTLFYTLPNWQEAVVAPIWSAKSPSIPWAVAGYALFGCSVGVHSLFFWKAIRTLGTVPVAVCKGVQLTGIFLCAHFLFCSSDPVECVWNNGSSESLWHKWQKTAAMVCCCAGAMMYHLGKEKKEVPEVDAVRRVLQVSVVESSDTELL